MAVNELGVPPPASEAGHVGLAVTIVPEIPRVEVARDSSVSDPASPMVTVVADTVLTVSAVVSTTIVPWNVMVAPRGKPQVMLGPYSTNDVK